MGIVSTYKGHDVPEGSTHYAAQDGCWREGFYDVDEGKFRGTEFGDCWGDSNMKRKGLIELPQAPEQYMPKVGEECEMKDCSQKTGWRECYIVGKTKDGIFVAEYQNGDVYAEDGVFRPIKTLREKVIDQCLEIYHCGKYSVDMAEALYDAGMLTMPGEE